jgi:hypothetical protein
MRYSISMTIDERLDALTHTVELLASMQQITEKNLQATDRNLDRLTREIRRFRHFVLAMGADIESRLLKLEGPFEEEQ